MDDDDDVVVRARWERESGSWGSLGTRWMRSSPSEGWPRSPCLLPYEWSSLPSDPATVAIPPQDPTTVIPSQVTVPAGPPLPHHGTVRGTASGYVGISYSGEDGLWRSFVAVHWHGGVDVFLGEHGGREWDQVAGTRRRMIYLHRSVAWAWAAFDLQREMIERFTVAGPFRAIMAVAHTTGASLGTFGSGWPEPGSSGFWDQPSSVEHHVLLVENLGEWPDAAGVEALAMQFGARLDLAFGGPGERHLDRVRPEAGKFKPRW